MTDHRATAPDAEEVKRLVRDAMALSINCPDGNAADAALAKAFAAIDALASRPLPQGGDEREAFEAWHTPDADDVVLKAVNLVRSIRDNLRDKARAFDAEAHPFNDKFGDRPEVLAKARAKAQFCRAFSWEVQSMSEKPLRELIAAIDVILTPPIEVQACRPEDRAMLAAPAGQELVQKVAAALRVGDAPEQAVGELTATIRAQQASEGGEASISMRPSERDALSPEAHEKLREVALGGPGSAGAVQADERRRRATERMFAEHRASQPLRQEGAEPAPSTCGLTECQGKPKCKRCLSYERTAEPPAPEPCRGIPAPWCNYLSGCGRICNKCGREHKIRFLTAAAPPASPEVEDLGSGPSIETGDPS